MHTRFNAILASAILAFSTPADALTPPQTQPATNKALPEVGYTDENGSPATVDAKGAKLTALHFWATWCVPCIAELPELDVAIRKYGPQGFRVIAISMDGKNQAKVKEFLAAHNIKELKPNLDTGAFYKLQLRGLPTTVFVNQYGDIIARSEGPVEWASPQTTGFIEQALE